MIPYLFHVQTCHLPLHALTFLKGFCHFKGSAIFYKQNTDLPLVRNDRTDCFNSPLRLMSLTVPSHSPSQFCLPISPALQASFLRADCLTKGSVNGNLRVMLID